jgi:hypothetical protein
LDNFDKILAQKLQQEQEFDFRESDWQDVANTLDAAAPAPNAFAWKSWAAAVILVSLLGGIGWLVMALTAAKNTIQELKSQPVEENFRVDTIYKEVAVVRVDTVFKTRTIATAAATNIFATTPFFANNQKINTHDISVTGAGILGTSFFSPFFNADGRRQTVDGRRGGSIGVSAEEKDVVSADLKKMAILEGEALAYPVTELKIKEISTSELDLNNDPRLRDYMRPIGAKAGVSVGKSFLTANGLTNVSSSNVGLKGEVNFVKNISLVGAIDWFNLSYQTTDYTNLGRDIQMPNLEDLGSANPNDLTFASVSESFTQYKIGLKYNFQTKTTAVPYIGLSYLASTNVKKDFYYFYDIPASQGLDVQLEDSDRFNDFHSNGFGLDLGVELQTQKWLSLQIEGYYHFITPEMRSQYYDLLGIRLAALINFKR